MSRRDQLAGIDPLGRRDETEQSRTPMSISEADAALFGELSRREATRQTVRPVSIFDIHPDIKQARRAVPVQARGHWSGDPRDIADLFNAWLGIIGDERRAANQPPFDLNEHLWAEVVESRQREEDEGESAYRPGPVERAFLAVTGLAVSIRRDGLANPVTIQRVGPNHYQLETGERRWLAYHILYGYFNGDGGKPQERDRWEGIPAIVVDDFNVWRQASENTARADLNAIGRARQFAILLMDLLSRQGKTFQPYETLVKPGQSDRAYYAQVGDARVPKGKGEILANAMGVSHRAAFTRCRILLGLPDEIWLAGDDLDLPEDELLRLAKFESVEEAIEETRRIAANVATRNKTSDSPSTGKTRSKKQKPPTLFPDSALNRGKKLFSRQIELVAREIFAIRDGVGQADPGTKLQILEKVEELRDCLDTLEETLEANES
jgi:hypothetical protein